MEEHEPTWRLHLELIPTPDGRFARWEIEIVPPETVRTFAKGAGSGDMLYERVQGDLNGALRQLCNDLQHMLKKRKTGQTR